MIMELLLYEVSTTAAGLLGLKAISMSGVRRQLQSINMPKRLPIVDQILRNKIGHTSKTERFVSRRVASTIQNATRFQAFRYLIILAMRRKREKD